MKNIGILVYDSSLVGGAERVAINLSNELSNYYCVHLISLFQENKNNTVDKTEYINKILFEKTVSITKNLFLLSKKLKKYLIDNNIDILFSITAGVNTVALFSTKGTNIRTIYCEHSNLENKTYGKKHQLRQYLGSKFMDKIVTLTERDRVNFIKKYNLPENKVIAIPNWFEKVELKKESYDKNTKKIITVGRLEKVKGHDLLVNVAKKVKEKHSDWIWEIYGEGKYRKEIEENIKNNALGDFLKLKGNVNNLKEIYNKYSFFVLTSYYEGLPLVLLEAQQANLPIVSFDCPTGPSEIIKNNKNGFIISTYDTDLMAEKINELIENPEMREKFSDNAQININKFDKKVVLKQWLELIKKL